MVQISEVKSSNRDHRTSAHTHIKGLGLKPDGTAERQASGFVGQATAREVRGGGSVFLACNPRGLFLLLLLLLFWFG